MLENTDTQIKASFFISGFIHLLGNETFDSINKTFVDKKFDWNKIKLNCKEFFIYHSDNDPYVPIKFGKELANKLNTKLDVIKNAGHFNEKSGYLKFEILFNNIKQFL